MAKDIDGAKINYTYSPSGSRLQFGDSRSLVLLVRWLREYATDEESRKIDPEGTKLAVKIIKALKAIPSRRLH